MRQAVTVVTEGRGSTSDRWSRWTRSIERGLADTDPAFVVEMKLRPMMFPPRSFVRVLVPQAKYKPC